MSIYASLQEEFLEVMIPRAPFKIRWRRWQPKIPDSQKPIRLGGGFNFFLFSPLFGEDSHFD